MHFPKIECDDAEIKMSGDTTPIESFLSLIHPLDTLGTTEADQKGGGSGVAAAWTAEWLDSIRYARMKVQRKCKK